MADVSRGDSQGIAGSAAAGEGQNGQNPGDPTGGQSHGWHASTRRPPRMTRTYERVLSKASERKTSCRSVSLSGAAPKRARS